MIKSCKICGISDLNTLNHIINHSYPPQFIGFICNYKKSPRYITLKKAKELGDIAVNDLIYIYCDRNNKKKRK